MTRALVALVWVGAACAASSRGDGMRNPDVVHEQDDRVRLCNAAATLHAASCAPFASVPDAKLDDCSIVDGLYLSGYAACLATPACDAVTACVARVDAGSAAAYAGPLRACDAATPTVPAGVSAAELATSYGAHDHTFDDSKSTLAQPIEVCGGPAQIDYLMRVTCPDGSHAFRDRATAAAARTPAGNGGRCGRVVDHVIATCPDHPYDIFIDAYRCPARG